MDFFTLTTSYLENLDVVWTFLLLVIRYGAFFIIVPALGGGTSQRQIRMPCTLLLAFVSLMSSPKASVPNDIALMAGGLISEASFGFLIGLIPALIVSGVQLGAQLSSTTMGLGAAQLLDPNLGIQVASLGRMFGDLTAILFLTLGGHHLAIYVLSGLVSDMVPGTFLVNDVTLRLLIQKSAEIFEIGVIVSAPVVIALLLTQFVMGLISKAVPSVNIFIVSFPLTIGIGLILSILALPEVLVYVERHLSELEYSYSAIVESL